MQTGGRPSTIVLKSPYGRHDEARPNATVKCGHLVKLNSDGTIAGAATAGGFARLCFAVERSAHSMVGKGIDDSYASGDLASIFHALPGDEILAWLKDGENVAIGDQLIQGDVAGELIKITGTPKQIVAEAIELLDLSGGGITASQRIKIRVW